MSLNNVEREKVNDSRLKLQSAARVLRGLNHDQIPDYEDIEKCLEDAEGSLRQALHDSQE